MPELYAFPVSTEPHGEWTQLALNSQSGEGDWLCSCSCFFKILIFFWLSKSSGKLPREVKNHLLRFLLCFPCCPNRSRGVPGRGARSPRCSFLPCDDLCPWARPQIAVLRLFILKMRGLDLLDKGSFSSKHQDEETLCVKIFHWNFSCRKRAFEKYIMRLSG